MIEFGKRIRGMTAALQAGAMALAAAFAVLIAAPGGAGVSDARAQTSCQIDFGILTKKRMGQIAALNAEAKKRKGKLDPRSACPRLRNLAAVEGQMLAYMKKNKAWCGIPDEPIKQMTSTRSKTASLAGQACKAANLMRKAIANARRQQQSPAGAPPPPKLPTGPL